MDEKIKKRRPKILKKFGTSQLVEELEDRFGPLAARNRKHQLEKVVKIVCDVYGVTEAELLSSRRTKLYSVVRTAICYILTKYFSTGMVEVGVLLHKDHSTVHYHLSRHSNRTRDRWYLSQYIRCLSVMLEEGLLQVLDPKMSELVAKYE